MTKRKFIKSSVALAKKYGAPIRLKTQSEICEDMAAMRDHWRIILQNKDIYVGARQSDQWLAYKIVEPPYPTHFSYFAWLNDKGTWQEGDGVGAVVFDTIEEALIEAMNAIDVIPV